MQRKMKLICKILAYIERVYGSNGVPTPEFPDYSDSQVHYHIGLCLQAGYLTAQVVSGAEERFPRYEIGTLTWQGHEALEALRAR